MKQDVEVSIIIPYDKDRGYLGKAVTSAEAQDFDSFEVIIWQGDHYLGKNINDALKKAKGEWIKILAEDDILPSNSIRDLYTKAIEGYDWVCGDAENFGFVCDPSGVEECKSIVTSLQEMIIKNTIHGGTTLYKKSMLFEVGGYDETLWTGEE